MTLLNSYRFAGGGGGGSYAGPTIVSGSHVAGYALHGGANTQTAYSSYAVPAGDDKILVVRTSGRRSNNTDPYPVTSVTHNGVAMTELTGFQSGDRGAGGPSRQQIFILYLGATTPTGDIQTTTSQYYHLEVDIFVIQGAAQSSQPAAIASSGATDSTSTAVTGISGDCLVVDGVIVAETADNLTNDETLIDERLRSSGGASYPAFRTGMQAAEVSADKTMAWTYTGSADRYHAGVAFAAA